MEADCILLSPNDKEIGSSEASANKVRYGSLVADFTMRSLLMKRIRQYPCHYYYAGPCVHMKLSNSKKTLGTIWNWEETIGSFILPSMCWWESQIYPLILLIIMHVWKSMCRTIQEKLIPTSMCSEPHGDHWNQDRHWEEQSCTTNH